MSSITHKIYKVVENNHITYYVKVADDVFMKICCNCKHIKHPNIIYTGVGGQLISELIRISGQETNTLDILVTTGLSESDIQGIYEQTYNEWWKKQ